MESLTRNQIRILKQLSKVKRCSRRELVEYLNLDPTSVHLALTNMKELLDIKILKKAGSLRLYKLNNKGLRLAKTI